MQHRGCRGPPWAGTQCLIVHKKLWDWIKGIIGRLFDNQMWILEKSMLRRFQAALLQKMDGNDGVMLSTAGDRSKSLELNAKALRSTAFLVGALLLEVPSLSLTKSRAVHKMDNKPNSALILFPDLPVARIRSLAKVDCVVSSKKQPAEGSMSVAMDLIAMVHLDGFGNLQGFAWYQLGLHSVTVGVHNNADGPGIIFQFGGIRPPFLRVQLKLNLDVEL